MKKDIFAKGWITPVLILVAVLAGFLPDETRNIIWVVFFFLIGGLCAWDYNKCGRVHCQITGIGFPIVGVLALLNVLALISIDWGLIWGIFLLVFGIGYAIEFRYKSKTGTCYRK